MAALASSLVWSDSANKARQQSVRGSAREREPDRQARHHERDENRASSLIVSCRNPCPAFGGEHVNFPARFRQADSLPLESLLLARQANPRRLRNLRSLQKSQFENHVTAVILSPPRWHLPARIR